MCRRVIKIFRRRNYGRQIAPSRSAGAHTRRKESNDIACSQRVGGHQDDLLKGFVFNDGPLKFAVRKRLREVGFGTQLGDQRQDVGQGKTCFVRGPRRSLSFHVG